MFNLETGDNRKEIIAKEWTKLLLILIPKKGDLIECSNYRTFSLTNHSSKILLNIILQRLKQEIEPYLPEEQAGFKNVRITVPPILCSKMVADKYREVDKIVR